MSEIQKLKTCPKCEVGKMTGPKYHTNEDKLIWVCNQCGYVEKTKPKDAKN